MCYDDPGPQILSLDRFAKKVQQPSAALVPYDLCADILPS